jgi:glucose/arabinose dehydrogenase
MALFGEDLYIAETDALRKTRYVSGDVQASGPLDKVVDLPAGPRNYHWTKNVIVAGDGRTLYVTVGSNSNVAEHGLDEERERAAILAIDLGTSTRRIFASGLRNPIGLAWHPTTGELWTTVNERDELGSDLVPDYLTSVSQDGFYGWPYSYFGQHIDQRVTPQRPELVARAVQPDYALGPHTASMGLDFARGEALPLRYRNGAFVGQHGSWNRDPLSGYKVIFVPFEDGKPKGAPIDVLTDFLNEQDHARGRPVGIAVEGHGSVLVADDVGDTVWRITSAGQKSPLKSSSEHP